MTDYRTLLVLVLDSDGSNLGDMSFRAAQNLAQDRNLDLVKVNKSDDMPVYKIMDHGKWKYDKKKSKKKNASHTHHHQTKEVNFRVRTEEHDLLTKINQIKKFISKEMNVKITVSMRGREKHKPEVAKAKLQSVLNALGELVVPSEIFRNNPGLMSATVRPAPQGKKNATNRSTNGSRSKQPTSSGNSRREGDGCESTNERTKAQVQEKITKKESPSAVQRAIG